MQLPTPEDCMAIMARPPPSQHPVAMPMPSSSVLSVTRPILSSASIRLRRLVRPPSGTVQTSVKFRACMARNTSRDQWEPGGGTRYSSRLFCQQLSSGDAREAFHGIKVAELAHARGKSGSQRLVDVKYAFCDDLAVGRREDEFVEALRTLNIVEQPALALIDVVHDELAEAVRIFDAVDSGEQCLLAHQICEPSAHIADDGELMLRADDALTDLMQAERGALAVRVVA